ncbi:prolyl oligopeptidase family serine peptidase [Streptomyces sp. NPDC091292]|uniref:prolyl oligopeptidase family serine peptidase n=1 Tax=Streptomyces sp. NPDC091292 TaxID=3365991 RepID=UPI003829206A
MSTSRTSTKRKIGAALPRRFGLARLLAGATVLGLTLAACSDGGGGTASTSSAPSATPTACPTTEVATPSAPDGGATPDRPSIPIAKTIAPSDTSTSEVVTADGPQIECGTTDVEAHKDLVYASPSDTGKKIDLKLDVLTPAGGSATKPLVVYLPGGGFMQAQKAAALDQRTYLAEQGYVVASITYRTTADGATYKEGVSDVKSAIRYLRAHADEYGIDPDRVAVWGESAGGYLAAMVGTTNGVKDFESGDHLDRSSDVQAVIDKFGASDLSKVGADYDDAAKAANVAPGNNLALYVYGPSGADKSVAEYTDEVAAADPATYADGDDPAFLEMHGSKDRLISPSQTLLLHEALRAKGADSTRYVLTGADHGDMAFMGDTEAGKPWITKKALGYMVDFLDKQLRA